MTGQQLKNSILQMAVQGKLVPQDPNDEPASVLLERIRKEKERLIKEKKIKPEKNPSFIFRGADNLPYEKIGKEVRCIADEVPFEIPASWEWVRFSTVVNYSIGKTPPRKENEYWTPDNFYWVSIADMRADDKIYTTKEKVSTYAAQHSFRGKISPAGTLLMSFKLTVGKVSILQIDAFHNEAIISIYPYCDDNKTTTQYLFKCLPLLSQMGDSKNAVMGNTLNSQSLDNLLIPFPPQAEQRRIVQLIERLQPYLAEYELKEASLVQLNSRLSSLLKKSILQQAIQGKLVPQSPDDEPASVLLERIRKEKARLVKEGKLKPDKHESVIFRRDNSHYEKRNGKEVCIDDEIPFEIPSSWTWVRLRSLLSKASTGPFGSMLHKSDYVEQGTPLVNPANIHDGEIIIDGIKRVASPTATRLSAYLLDVGDVIIGRRGELGRSAVICNEHIGWLCGTGCFFVTPMPGFSPEYLVFLLASPYVRDALMSASVGTTMNNLNHDILKQLLIPFPPEKEQRKILRQYEKTCAFLSW